jgi:hypothetical protein
MSRPETVNRIDVVTLSQVAGRQFDRLKSSKSVVCSETIPDMLRTAAAEVGDHRFSDQFLWTEWTDIIDTWQIGCWDDYKDVQRLGRRTRLRKEQRATVWEIFRRVIDELNRHGLITNAGVLRDVRLAIESTDMQPEYEFAVIDEAQDISILELQFVAALGDSADRRSRTPRGLRFRVNDASGEGAGVSSGCRHGVR